MTLGPNKGPSELLRPLASGGGVGRGSRSGRSLSPTQPCPAPSRKPLRWHCQGCRAFLRTVLGVLGFRQHCSQQISPRSVSGRALPRPTLPGLHPSAVFPIKAGIPGWAQTKRDRGKSTPQANQTLAHFSRARLGSQRCLLVHTMWTVPEGSPPEKK